MDTVSLNSDPAADDEGEEFEIEGDCPMAEYSGQNGVIQAENPLPPAVGMEFESYEDVYYFYKCYAKEQGFGVRVNNTWYRKGKEKYRGKFSCSSAGFKRKSKSHNPKPETRTGCPAMIKLRLMDNKRWRIIEIELAHNHVIGPGSGKLHRSHKTIGLRSKRSLEMDGAEDIQTLKLFRTVIIDSKDDGNANVGVGEFENGLKKCTQLKLQLGDSKAIHNFFCRMQLLDPHFVYLMDLNERGCLRNVFWTNSRSRAAYNHFGDVVMIDNTCLTQQYEAPLVTFVGQNHHMQPILLGCGLVSPETTESFIWLLRAWLTCMLGRGPNVIITNQCKTLQTAVADVFPRASHCFSLSHIMHQAPEKLGELHDYEALRKAFSKLVCSSLKVNEFEASWQDMIHHFGVMEHTWLKELYEDRKQWVPVYLKETYLAGIFPIKENEDFDQFFNVRLVKDTPLREFFKNYDQALQMSYQEEALADTNSNIPTVTLKSKFCFELQLSKLYSNNAFGRFQSEVEGMYSCINGRQVSMDGTVITYIVKEQFEENNRKEAIDYEVLYNSSEGEVSCNCGLFNFKGYLCRHALVILSQNMEEIPAQYILSRWRKDINRSYIYDDCSTGIDVSNPVHRYDHLYRRGLQVVDKGKGSNDHYKAALEGLNEILIKVQLLEDQ